jgi:hypothetical protein
MVIREAKVQGLLLTGFFDNCYEQIRHFFDERATYRAINGSKISLDSRVFCEENLRFETSET